MDEKPAMDAKTETRPLTVALEHMTGPARGAVTWLGQPTLDITLDAGCLLHVAETRPGPPPEDLAARLHRRGDTYEIEAPEGGAVWVNGERIAARTLEHGDTIEFGETGPLCRCRLYAGDVQGPSTVSDIVSDAIAYLRVSRQPPARRALRALSALFARLSRETTLLFRITTIVAIIVIAAVAWRQQRLTERLQQSIDAEIARVESVSAALVRAQNEALRPADLNALREELAERVTSSIARLEQLERRSEASGRVIARSAASVAFLQGAYGFREVSSDRMLRHMVTAEGAPLISPRGQPLLTLEGDGPIAELQFIGTGFLVGDSGALITNRHVALPWERETGSIAMMAGDVEPVITRFIVYFPGRAEAVPVRLLAASETSDLALLALDDGADSAPGLRLAETLPASGDEVIVMGYPTGLRSMLAQSGMAFIEELQKAADTGFWSVAKRLAEAGYIAPLASRGIIGQITPAAIVYDAETTHGGSGGPVLDIHGDVLAVNSAILPEYGGSNLGVPVAEVRALLEQAGLR